MSLETPVDEMQNTIEHNEVQNMPEGKGDFSERTSVNLVAVGIRSAFITFVAAVLAFGCFLSFFPYTAMRMYSSLDLKYMALVSAEKYLSRNADEYDEPNGKLPDGFGKYADALYLATNNSMYFFDEAVANDGYGSSAADFYAQKVDKYASIFIACRSDLSLGKRINAVDDYSLRNTVPAMHPYVYSYLDKLETARFKAWYALGEYEKILRRQSDAITYWGQDTWEITLPSVEQPALVASDFLFLSQLSTYINAELENLGLKDIINGAKEPGRLTFDLVPESLNLFGKEPFVLFLENDFTPLYTLIKSNYDKFVDYIKANATKYSTTGTEQNIAMHLRHTYYLKSLSDFTYSMNNMFAVLRAKSEYFDETIRDTFVSDYNYWEGKLQVSGVRVWSEGQYQTRRVSIKQWYELGMLQDYIKF